MLRRFSGATVRRVIDRSDARVPEHAHDWPVLSIFVLGANSQTERAAPSWVHAIDRRLRNDPTPGVDALAREVGRHPSWFGTAYRKATGEGLMETAARLRVERAARALRETNQSCAYIAHEAGFCDQSHMNRTFRRLLGRAPTELRDDRTAFREMASGA